MPVEPYTDDPLTRDSDSEENLSKGSCGIPFNSLFVVNSFFLFLDVLNFKVLM